MIDAIRKAYYGGVRAGKAQPVLQPTGQGTYTLKQPVNPYAGKNFILAFVWNEGEHDGTVYRLVQFKNKRKVYL